MPGTKVSGRVGLVWEAAGPGVGQSLATWTGLSKAAFPIRPFSPEVSWRSALGGTTMSHLLHLFLGGQLWPLQQRSPTGAGGRMEGEGGGRCMLCLPRIAMFSKLLLLTMLIFKTRVCLHFWISSFLGYPTCTTLDPLPAADWVCPFTLGPP